MKSFSASMHRGAPPPSQCHPVIDLCTTQSCTNTACVCLHPALTASVEAFPMYHHSPPAPHERKPQRSKESAIGIGKAAHQKYQHLINRLARWEGKRRGVRKGSFSISCESDMRLRSGLVFSEAFPFSLIYELHNSLCSGRFCLVSDHIPHVRIHTLLPPLLASICFPFS